MPYFRDKISIDPVTKSVNLSRSGIYQYTGEEIGLNDNKVYNVYRPESTVEKTAQLLNDYQAIPLLINHPKQFVDIKDDKNYTKGGVGNGVVREEKGYRVCGGDLVGLTDEMKDFVSKGQEVSLGSYGELKVSDSPEYDFVMEITDINHLAIVNRGRAGDVCSIRDGVSNRQLVLQELNNKKKEKMTDKCKKGSSVEEKKDSELEDTLTGVKGKKVVDSKEKTEETPAGADAGNQTEDKAGAESEKEVKAEDSKELVDIALVDKAREEGLEAGKKETQQSFIDAISLVNAGIIKVSDLLSNPPCEIIDKAVLKLLDKKSFEDEAERKAGIKLTISQANKKTWNFNDTKQLGKHEFKKGSFISNIFN